VYIVVVICLSYIVGCLYMSYNLAGGKRSIRVAQGGAQRNLKRSKEIKQASPFFRLLRD
jgi:hypothetical protein